MRRRILIVRVLPLGRRLRSWSVDGGEFDIGYFLQLRALVFTHIKLCRMRIFFHEPEDAFLEVLLHAFCVLRMIIVEFLLLCRVSRAWALEVRRS